MWFWGLVSKYCELVSGCLRVVLRVGIGYQENGGGLRDKPEKRRDYYHTCYCLRSAYLPTHAVRMYAMRGTKLVHPLACSALNQCALRKQTQ